MVDTIDYTKLIRDRAVNVLSLRCKQSDLEEQLSALKATWEAENNELIEAVEQAIKERSEAEHRLRDLSLAAHRVIGEKRFPGVESKVYTKLEYEPDEALLWAVTSAAIFVAPVSLKVKEFEAYAKGNPLDFVTRSEDPRAQIATKLAEALEGEPVRSVPRGRERLPNDLV